MREFIVITEGWLVANYWIFPTGLLVGFGIVITAVFIDNIVRFCIKSEEDIGTVGYVGAFLFVVGAGTSALWFVAIFLVKVMEGLFWLGDAIKVINNLM